MLLVCFLAVAVVVSAQNKKPKVAPSAAKTVAKAKYRFKSVPVYLGNSEWRNGAISKSTFDSLVAQGLTAIDSAGVSASVVEFRIYYKQRMLYEDSVGNYYTDLEMLTDFAKGNKLNAYVNLQDRTKKGDTAIFDDIVVMLPDSILAPGQSMKFAITK